LRIYIANTERMTFQKRKNASESWALAPCHVIERAQDPPTAAVRQEDLQQRHRRVCFFFKINKKIKTPNRSAARRPLAKTPPCLNLKNNKKIKTSSKAPPVCEPRKTNLKL